MSQKLKCGDNNIIGGLVGMYRCIAHGSIYEDKVCPKKHNKFIFTKDCWE